MVRITRPAQNVLEEPQAGRQCVLHPAEKLPDRGERRLPPLVTSTPWYTGKVLHDEWHDKHLVKFLIALFLSHSLCIMRLCKSSSHDKRGDSTARDPWRLYNSLQIGIHLSRHFRCKEILWFGIHGGHESPPTTNLCSPVSRSSSTVDRTIRCYPG